MAFLTLTLSQNPNPNPNPDPDPDPNLTLAVALTPTLTLTPLSPALKSASAYRSGGTGKIQGRYRGEMGEI